MTDVADGDVTYDLGNMAVFDANQPKNISESTLFDVATAHCQELVAKLFELPTAKSEGGRVAELPMGTTLVPREKPIPKEKELTKWEEFRLEKGIKKRKTEKKVFNELTQEFMPAYGVKRRRVERQLDWLREVPDNYQPKAEGGDAFLDAAMEKKEKAGKQKARQAANERRARDNTQLLDIKTATSRLATASMGKFDAAPTAPKRGSKPKSSGPKKSKMAQRKRR
eukprot:TRINITY_DN8454_c0_g1_i1.p1 TRINITY_DN8454_c0_g1~~TRINITY_DN8454_c0_g1_i1.p1  ORF type:complete len:240 (+),score=112.77 TRINITY_DN8454_c0_g1_i1:48-722(+)